ncbi:PLP-dependent aminotransferase family protein [Cupriavidus pauculus]|uniref:MocR-like pyridoxine biosynthesis transcription factor PdxR n=1 Tax=Cupriavidus pauculus TaxID=82633 RepID=UPI001EE339DA|nr:PLP-dependent aminotransferase family protein [Cupriavidus pauculus]GJG96942.1 PLP-dependent aminotransferase family protein [Cupriavidus pauculus]
MSRTAKVPEIPFIGALDRDAGPLSRQLVQALRDAVACGDLKPGESLPSTRALAEALGVSRGTVVEAFEQLVAEGVCTAQHGAGTRVAALTPAPVTPRRARGDIRLPAAAQAFASIAKEFTALPQVPFAVSVPAGAAAPNEAWRRLGNRLRAGGGAQPAGYGEPQGTRPLREAIADYLRRSRSVHCDAGQVVITTGTQQGLFLSCQVLLEPADPVWVENPAYRGITAILESTGPRDRIVRVPVDDEGIDVEAGIALARDARAAFVTPSHQYPLGMPLSMARRKALLAWADAQQAWVVEDDYDSELRYAGHPFPSLQGLAPERVVYLGTFSKILYPSLRLGYAVVPDALVDAFIGARVLMDRHPPTAEQHVLAAFIAEGHLDRHIRRVRGVHAERRAFVMEAIQRAIPPELAWLQPSDQGMHLVLWLAPGIDDREVVKHAADSGVAVRAVSPMYAGNKRPGGLVLGFGGFGDRQIEDAAQRLAGVIRAVASGVTRA